MMNGDNAVNYLCSILGLEEAPCPDCHGEGWVWLMQDGHKVFCSLCEGTGIVPADWLEDRA